LIEQKQLEKLEKEFERTKKLALKSKIAFLEGVEEANRAELINRIKSASTAPNSNAYYLESIKGEFEDWILAFNEITFLRRA